MTRASVCVDYAAARSEWIEIALESLLANIHEAVKGWPVLPGEPFQNVVLIDGDMYVITLDTVDGVTVASPTASKQALGSSPWKFTGSGVLMSRGRRRDIGILAWGQMQDGGDLSRIS